MTTHRKLALLGSLYLSQGLPFGFFTQAVPVLLRREGIGLQEIGLANMLALPWALKFLCAPFVDRHGSNRFGWRRTFILPLQLASVASLIALATIDPRHASSMLLVGFFLVNALAATQDVATDALAVDMLAKDERGWGNGVQVAGYRVGMVLGGGALLIVFERLGWARSFLTMALILLLATGPIAFHREPARAAILLPKAEARPLSEWLRRPGLWRWVGLLLAFKTGESFATAMLRPCLVDRGLRLSELGVMLGSVGFVAGLVGALLGGSLVARLGRRTSLVAFGALQTFAIALYAFAGAAPMGALYLLVAFEHLASGMATAALFTAMMDVCRPEHAATDYTLQACVVVVATGTGAALSGFSAHALGYPVHFLACAALSAAGALYAAVYRGEKGTFALVPTGA